MKEMQSNGSDNIITQAIEEIKAAQGNDFPLEKINLAELEYLERNSDDSRRMVLSMLLMV